MCSRIILSAACLAVAAFAQMPAPLYSACGPTIGCGAGLACQASVCVPMAAPVAPVVPAVPAVPAVPVAAPGCAGGCLGPAACVSGACQCAAPGVVYSPVVGCAPVPVAPVPVVAGRLIPQALPGAPCEPGVECTGGSVCSLGICVCPPELVQEGTVCVARTIYGVMPPAVIPMPVAPVLPAPAFIPVGAPCAAPVVVAAAPACVQGAVCGPAGVCACGPAFAPVQGACVRRKHMKMARSDSN